MEQKTNRLKLVLYLLSVLLVVLGLLLVLRGAFGAFRLSFSTTRGIYIPIDIIVGSLTPLIAILLITFSKENK